nr:MAG TPA: hypothetical protein [Caudoviricetes sp.]
MRRLYINISFKAPIKGAFLLPSFSFADDKEQRKEVD